MMKSMMKTAKKMAKMSMKKMASKMMKKTMKKAMKKTAAKYKSASGARRAVFSGKLAKSKGGLKREQLTKSKSGKIVSKKSQAHGKKVFTKYLAKWNKSVMAARKAMGIKGFQAIGGKSAKGQALLKKARSLYRK
jgi:hypothetical protein